jgi:DNA-binding NarL/FixJ family response regulator
VIRVLLVDDDVLVRAGLKMILDAEDDIVVVGEAESGTDAVRAALRLTPDVVLMDVEMPDGDGISATREITGQCEATAVVVLTTFELDEYLFESLRAGASGFLLKRSSPEQLLEAVRVAAKGEALLASSITLRVIREFARRDAGAPRRDERLELLTERETEVLRLVGQGYNNAEVAALTHVSESTAKTHLRRILMKLGLRDRVAAVVYAHEAGLAGPDG